MVKPICRVYCRLKSSDEREHGAELSLAEDECKEQTGGDRGLILGEHHTKKGVSGDLDPLTETH